MIDFISQEFQNLIATSAALRGQGRFLEAANLIEGKLPEMAQECFTIAYTQIFYAYKEAGILDKAKTYAKKLQRLHPDLPSIQGFLE